MSGKRFATLASLKNDDDEVSRDSGGSSGGEDEEQKRRSGQSFYVGGSVSSGQKILGPPRKKNDDQEEDMTELLFRSARASGAETVDKSEGSYETLRFQGRGYRVGDDPNKMEETPDVHDSKISENAMQAVVLNMWQDGFSIDDGPLRRFADGENRDFLQSIMKGRIPTEMLHLYPGKEIDLKILRKSSPFIPPKEPRSPAFSGQGRRLGGIVPKIAGEQVDDSGPVVEDAVIVAQKAVKIEQGDTTTQDLLCIFVSSSLIFSFPVQIRLPNGEKIVVKMADRHTVAELREFIVTAHPSLAFHPFSMMTTFPSCEITDESRTLFEAGLLNTTIVLKSN